MNDLIDQINEILKNEVAERHSFYQLKFFVLGAEPTTQAKLQCCLRELRTKRQSLDAIGRELEDLKDHNDLLVFEMERIAKESCTDDHGFDIMDEEDKEKFKAERALEIRNLERKKADNERKIGDLRRTARYVLEECQFFVTAFQELTKEEPLKDWDSLEVQKEYWDVKLGKELKTRLLLGQPLDSEFIKCIDQLHDDSTTKQAVLQLMQKQEELHKANQIETTKMSLIKELEGSSNQDDTASSTQEL